MRHILAWHFTMRPGVLRYGIPRIPGVVEAYDSPPVLCERGLHASVHALDACCYAPGPHISLVECSGTILLGDDKLVCTRRKPLWVACASDVLRWFAKDQARSVLHLWDCPVPEAVRLWLDEENVSEEARIEAESAARRAAWSAARSASAAWCAARSAAWSAAWSAAENAARSAVGSAAWSANAAWSAVWSAAESAAESAARRAARSAVGSATRCAARSAANQQLESLLMELGNSFCSPSRSDLPSREKII